VSAGWGVLGGTGPEGSETPRKGTVPREAAKGENSVRQVRCLTRVVSWVEEEKKNSCTGKGKVKVKIQRLRGEKEASS